MTSGKTDGTEMLTIKESGDGSKLVDFAAVEPSFVMGCVSGAILVMASLSQVQYRLLDRLVSAMNQIIKGVGGFSHKSWRAFCNERRIPSGDATCKNFIDGDLVEMYDDLARGEKEKVVSLMNRDGTGSPAITVDDVVKVVDDLKRLH